MSISAFGSFQAYEATETNAFCGQTCHTVMKPEFVAFQNSPHARLHCVDCHVGSGRNGTYDPNSMGCTNSTRSLSRLTASPSKLRSIICAPRATPVPNVTGPTKTGAGGSRYSTTMVTTRRIRRVRFACLSMSVAQPQTGRVSGIHWHMNLANEITYLATDDQRQVIPWIQSKDSNGNVTVYVANNAQLTSAQIESAPSGEWTASIVTIDPPIFTTHLTY